TGEQMLKLLTSVCTSSFHYRWTGIFHVSDFLLDLYSHLKIYETQTGRSFLPALQSLTGKELRPPGSAETTNTEETSRAERIEEFPSVSALHLTAE
ncbi:hypothetical protein M9458_007615, partial [Cirrhinus mrigala]